MELTGVPFHRALRFRKPSPFSKRDIVLLGCFFWAMLFVALCRSFPPNMHTGILSNLLYFCAISSCVSIVAAIDSLEGRKTASKLHPLAVEIEKYNRVAKAVMIRQELELAGNKIAIRHDSEKVVEALVSIRQDLVRALKTERILRKNKDFLEQNPIALVSDFATLQPVQLENQAGEWGELFDEAMAIAISVREEMKLLEPQMISNRR
jgi:hypothetical protein